MQLLCYVNALHHTIISKILKETFKIFEAKFGFDYHSVQSLLQNASAKKESLTKSSVQGFVVDVVVKVGVVQKMGDTDTG